MTGRVAFIGAVGVPNNYGGFEMFLETCVPEFAKIFDQVLITCDRGRYDDKSAVWHGARRIFVPLCANGPTSVLHDLFAFLSVMWRVEVIVVLGVSGGIFFPLFRLLAFLFNKKIIVNVDGLEWRREKFSKLRRCFLYLSDRLAQIFAHIVVVDNEALRGFLFRSTQQSAKFIPYPGDHVSRQAKLPKKKTGEAACLTICRIEPENNCHILLEAFARIGRGTYIFIGNWEATQYGRDLRQKYGSVVGLEMRDAVYDKNVLSYVRENCTLYLHGHSVGGTNPSLVEMLFYDSGILAFDCSFNRCTAGDAVQYFSGCEQLISQILSETWRAQEPRSGVRAQYTRAKICDAYVKIIYSFTSNKFRSTKRYWPTK